MSDTEDDGAWAPAGAAEEEERLRQEREKQKQALKVLIFIKGPRVCACQAWRRAASWARLDAAISLTPVAIFALLICAFDCLCELTLGSSLTGCFHKRSLPDHRQVQKARRVTGAVRSVHTVLAREHAAHRATAARYIRC